MACITSGIRPQRAVVLMVDRVEVIRFRLTLRLVTQVVDSSIPAVAAPTGTGQHTTTATGG